MRSMNKLSSQRRAQILNLFVEGNSLRAASRISDTAYNTVTKLFVTAGTVFVSGMPSKARRACWV